MNMRINTGSCAAACLKEEISHRHNSQAQRQGATMCLQSPIYQGVPEVGSEQGYWENLCIDDVSQQQKRHSCWGLEGPRTSPRDCVFPTCQSAKLASVFASVLASTAFPLWHQGTYFSTCFWLTGKRLQRATFLQDKRVHGVTERLCQWICS